MMSQHRPSILLLLAATLAACLTDATAPAAAEVPLVLGVADARWGEAVVAAVVGGTASLVAAGLGAGATSVVIGLVVGAVAGAFVDVNVPSLPGVDDAPDPAP